MASRHPTRLKLNAEQQRRLRDSILDQTRAAREAGKSEGLRHLRAAVLLAFALGLATGGLLLALGTLR